MPTPTRMIHITARGLSRARFIANELAGIEAALDLHAERTALQQELQAMGITLLPPNPAEQDPNGIPFPCQPKPQR